MSSNHVPTDTPDDPPHPTMSTYIFACPQCSQEIEVNTSMREAILSGGCPVCTEAAETADFESA